MPRAIIGDVELYYERHGKGEQAIAFVNGVAMTVQAWAPQQAYFAKEYTCLFHDTRGQLRSDKPATDYTLQMHAEDLKGLLDHLQLQKVHLVGASYGSEISMIFACAYPERARTLTVITGVSELDGVLRSAAESWAIAARHGGRCFYRCMVPWVYSSEYLERNRKLLQLNEMAMEQLPESYFEGFDRLIKAFLLLDITAELHRIRCPTLVVSAEKDLAKPPRFGRIIHEQIPNSEFIVVPGAGHGLVIERPDEVNRIVHDFIKRNDAS